MNINYPKKYLNTAIVAIALASMLVMAPMFGMAYAAKPGLSGVHFQGPEPTITCDPSTLRCSYTSFTLAGLGTGVVTSQFIVSATFKTQCENPAGNIAPGQDATDTESAPQQQIQVSGGKATVPGQTVFLEEPTDADIKCPNPKWVGSVVGTPILTATLAAFYNNIQVVSESFP